MRVFTIFCSILAFVVSSLGQSSAPASHSRDWVQQLAARHEAHATDHLRVHIFRLRPGDDLLESIQTYARARRIKAAIVLSAVGSLIHASVRFANQPGAAERSGHFEIVSLVGTVEQDGEHLHLSISSETGETIGGHLLPGCKIYTTAEIAIGELEGARFTRETDREGSGWDELKVFPEKTQRQK